MDKSTNKINKQDFDVIVVGSGPGGATVAKELIEQNKKVLLLEWGNNDPINGSKLQAIRNIGIPFKNVLITNKMLAMVRGTNVGGSSVYFYGTAFDPPFEMLLKYGIDISKETEEAKKELPIAPLQDHLIGPMANRIMQSAKNLGYNWEKLPKFVYQNKCRPECFRCNYGCPYGAKWNAKNYVEEAKEKGLNLIINAKVKKVLFRNKKAEGVEYYSTAERDTFKVYAPVVVVAGGGIGSPVILRNSGIKNAGYEYFFDPLIAVMGEVNNIKGGKEFPMATGIRMADEGYMMTDMTVPAALYTGFAAEVLRFDRLLSHPKTLTIMIKEKDRLGGRLTDCGGVRKSLDKKDFESLLKGYERAKGILKNAGAKKIFKSWYIAAHPGGTAKINDIVDSNLETQYQNLYVCDCSVIPESFGLPPTLTLIGLGKRLAKRIADSKQ